MIYLEPINFYCRWCSMDMFIYSLEVLSERSTQPINLYVEYVHSTWLASRGYDIQ